LFNLSDQKNEPWNKSKEELEDSK